MIGLGVGLFALLPRVGVLEIEDMKRLNYLPVFFVAAAISMGHVLEATKGLEVLTNAVFAWMQPFMTNVFSTTVVMYWTAFVYHFLLASEISMLGTSMPLVMEFAKAHGWNPLLLGMIWTFAAGGKLFAYQSGVLIVGYSYGFFAARDLVRMGAWLTLVEFVDKPPAQGTAQPAAQRQAHTSRPLRNLLRFSPLGKKRNNLNFSHSGPRLRDGTCRRGGSYGPWRSPPQLLHFPNRRKSTSGSSDAPSSRAPSARR